MFNSSYTLHALVFLSVVLLCSFIMITGSKWILSSCERDIEGECLSIATTSDLAAEVVNLNIQLAAAREAASQECNDVTISPRDWNAGNSTVLEGCWLLQIEWAMQYRDSGIRNRLIEWDFCLVEGQSTAAQNLYFEDNLQCVGQPLSYEFVRNQDGTQLSLMDVEDLSCTMNGLPLAKVIARELSCTLVPNGNYAECKVRDRIDQSWESGVVLRRRR